MTSNLGSVSVFLIGQRRSLDCPGFLKGHFEICCNELRVDEHCGATRDLKCAEFESLTSFQRSTWRQMPKGTLSGDLAHRRAGPTLTSHARIIDELYLSWALGIISGLNSLVRVAAKGTYRDLSAMDDDAMKRLLSQYCEELLVKRAFEGRSQNSERGDRADLQFPAAEGKGIKKYQCSRGPVTGANPNRPQPLHAAFFGSRRSLE